MTDLLNCEGKTHVWMPRDPTTDEEWECVICGDKPFDEPDTEQKEN